jgi:REP element-mobilizing transposase RayT
VVGYVIMPNHVHVLLFAPENHKVNTLLANAKRFLAYEAIKKLERSGRRDLLNVLSEATRPGDRERGQRHRVFTTSSDIKECHDEAMIHQKLDYIHANPVSGKWSLVDDPMDYPHSSMAFYERGTGSPAPLVNLGLVLNGEG